METELHRVMGKEELVGLIKKYVGHCRFVFLHSKIKHDVACLNSMVRCMDLMKWACREKDGMGMGQIKRFVLVNKNSLINILPNSKNSSYDSSVVRLKEIIESCGGSSEGIGQVDGGGVESVVS